MPLIESGTHEALTANIKELVRSGKKPKQAIAIGLANQQKYKQKMADGGAIESGNLNVEESLGNALTETSQSEILPTPGLSDSAKQAIMDRKKTRTFNQG